MVFTSSINDILSVKSRALQIFANQWRYLFECFSLICLQKFEYVILSNNLKKKDLSIRLYSQIFEGEQLVLFKKIGPLL